MIGDIGVVTIGFHCQETINSINLYSHGSGTQRTILFGIGKATDNTIITCLIITEQVTSDGVVTFDDCSTVIDSINIVDDSRGDTVIGRIDDQRLKVTVCDTS